MYDALRRKLVQGVLACCAALLALPLVAGAVDGGSETIYRLAAGDRVKVTVYGHEDLSGEFDLDGDGRLSLPLIRDIAAAGLSVRELEAARKLAGEVPLCCDLHYRA